MLSFADIVAPLTPETFFADIYGKKPAHLVAPNTEARRLIDGARLKQLLAVESHWTDQRLKLVYNGAPIPREEYCRPAGRELRADIPRVQQFLAQGVSLVADAVEVVAPELRDIGAVLSDRLGGLIGANVYLSFQNIGGFGPHYDLTEVFAFHCEGEKVWRLYEGRVEDPIAFPAGDEPTVREHFKREAGAVAQEVRMRPGDVLYIPRGCYHDALAQSSSSLHVTFSVLPHTGKIVLRLLEEFALSDPAFRKYLPDAALAGDTALSARLAQFSEALAQIVRSPEMLDAVRRRQQMLRG